MAQPPRTPQDKDDPHYAPESGDKPEADELGGVRERRDDAAPNESGRDRSGARTGGGSGDPRGGRDKLDGTS